jgi:hypothetical protein
MSAPAQDATQQARNSRLIEATLWAAAATVLLFLDGIVWGLRTNVYLGVFPLAYGVLAFLRHGGGRVTTLGLFNFACALFVGFAGTWEGLHPSGEAAPIFVAVGIYLAFLTQVAITLVAWGPDRADRELHLPATADARWVTAAGFLGLAAVFAAQQYEIPLSTSIYADGVAFTSVLLVTAGQLYRPATRLFSGRALLVVLVFGLYAAVFHQGTGRLRIVALACAIAMLATARFPRRWLKWVTVGAAPAAIGWLALDRLELQESLQAGASAGRNGLESMLTPIWVLGKIIEAQWTSGWPLALGKTLVTLPFAFIPDAHLPSWAPEALGYDLVRLTDPGRVGTGFSMASTAYGEWVWNFSVLGLVAAVPFMAWVCRTLDRRFEDTLARLDQDRTALLWLVAWGMTCGGVADLAWSGVHTFLTRTITRLPYLLVLGAWTLTAKPRERKPTAAELRADEARQLVAAARR